jgi:catechol 2,3-dioxygenase-like lactoylglutathione lyase family enzyme
LTPAIDEQITFLYTRDLAKTAHFYEAIMGFELAMDQGDCRIYRITETALLGFCERATAPESPRGIIFTLVTDAVDEWYRYLTGQGIEYETPPAVHEKYNIYHSFLRDPNGYLIEIQTFLDD